MHSAQYEILSPDPASAAQAAAFVEAWLEQVDTPMQTIQKLMIAADEIYSNIIRYSGAGRAVIRCKKEDDGIALTFMDDGKPYNPLEAPTPDVAADAAKRKIGGLGVFVVRSLMDAVEYRHEEGMNVLTVRKR